MALLTSCRTCKYYFCPLIQNLLNVRFKSAFVEVDTLDTFTTQLVQKKVEKWSKFHQQNKILCGVSPMRKMLKTQNNITLNNVNGKLQAAIEEEDVETIKLLLQTCKEELYFPVDGVSHDLLSYFAQTGYIEGVESMKDLSAELNPRFLQMHSDFKYFLAQAVWVKGNIPKALNLFHEAYRLNANQHRKIIRILRYLFTDAANNHSEAVIVSLLNFSESCVKEFKDYSALGCLWRACFLSEWFSNQTIAMDLLQKHEQLLKTVFEEIPMLVAESLRCHKTDPVYRLVELLLKYECEAEYSYVLAALFEYKYRQRDFPGCLQILHWCGKNNIKLSYIQHTKMIATLLKIDKNGEVPVKAQKYQKHNYNLKF